MPRSSRYFMHDQVRHRVAHMMHGHKRLSAPASPLWPLIVVIGAMTLVNLATAIPRL